MRINLEEKQVITKISRCLKLMHLKILVIFSKDRELRLNHLLIIMSLRELQLMMIFMVQKVLLMTIIAKIQLKKKMIQIILRNLSMKHYSQLDSEEHIWNKKDNHKVCMASNSSLTKQSQHSEMINTKAHQQVQKT